MSHAARQLIRGASERLRECVSAWNDFWFRPADPTNLAVIRILAGGIMLYTHAVWGLRLDEFFASHGWQSESAIRELQTGSFAISFWWWIPEHWTAMAHVISLLVLTLFTLGVATRISSILTCLVVMSYANRVPVANFGLDQINGILAFYLMIGPCGARLSIDALHKRRRAARQPGAIAESQAASPTSCARLSLRLIQIHLCIIYLSAGTSKLQGVTWWTGEALWNCIANYEYQSADLTWLAQSPWLIELLAHAVVVWEVSFAALVWPRVTRMPILLFGVVIHLGIGAFLGMWTFGFIMSVLYLAFLPPIRRTTFQIAVTASIDQPTTASQS